MNAKTYQPLDAQVRELEPAYQSNAEARIGRMLDRYDTPFSYRQPRLIYDQGYHDIWRPIFTLPPATLIGNGLVIGSTYRKAGACGMG